MSQNDFRCADCTKLFPKKDKVCAIHEKWIPNCPDYESIDGPFFEEDFDTIFGNKEDSSEKKGSIFDMIPPNESQMTFTYGKLTPCPYCGNRDIDSYTDGTAQCNHCKGWFRYAY